MAEIVHGIEVVFCRKCGAQSKWPYFSMMSLILPVVTIVTEVVRVAVVP